MLRSAKDMLGWKISASDGEIGKAHDFLFEDETWTVRYMVADTGSWLTGRLVLLSPASLASPELDARAFPVKLTRQQIEESPPLDSDAPVSRQHEIDLAQHFQWPVYWSGGILTGAALGGFPQPMIEPVITPVGQAKEEADARATETGDPHLRSMREVDGDAIGASDGDIGHVSDFIVDDANWAVRYLEVDTRNWLPGKHVLVAPEWIEMISWEQQKVGVALTQAQIKDAPEYKHRTPVDRPYEEALYKYYGRSGYWQTPAVAASRR